MRYYVYALIESKHTPDLSGLVAVGNPDTALKLVAIGDIAAIVSEFELDEIISTRRHMLTHTKVLENVMLQCSILPFSFGTIVDGIAKINALIEGHQRRLSADLKALDGYIEVGVKVTWNEDKIFKEIMQESAEISRAAAQLKTRPAAETYYARIDLGREIETQMKSKKAVEGAKLIERLSAFVDLKVIKEPKAEMVILDAAFLVRANKEAALINELEAIDRENPERLTFKLVAPVPPYNFVSLKLNVQNQIAA
jgi:hypothetical protein